ncbi:MAG: 50S ribosomal protein L21e [Candidatus Diapherotrites archaeon]|nr:50S ribosomal protein L21e [Candidatus Diapherotrites archaeon]
MQKSKGKLRGHGRKLRRPVRKTGITKHLQEFKVGEKVCIDIDSSRRPVAPLPKFQGRMGEIEGKQGTAYKVKIKDGGLTKTLLVDSVHLKR